VDGAVARSRNLVTTFGKVADPIADKALTGVALLGLSLLGELPWWVTIVILGREVGITLARFLVIRHGVIPASRGGKAKTVTQMFAILLYILPVAGWVASVRGPAMVVAVALTVLTGVDYLVRAVHLRRTSARTAMKKARRGRS
jgi:CDP-diacylglycerol--glycerol-3-phosphate 3-phosphatidyltransferase